jgi:hypothetical protein
MYRREINEGGMHSRGLRLSLHIGRLHVGNRALVQKLKKMEDGGVLAGEGRTREFC